MLTQQNVTLSDQTLQLELTGGLEGAFFLTPPAGGTQSNKFLKKDKIINTVVVGGVAHLHIDLHIDSDSEN